eukprot:m.1596922 g.1596922  ORF g.1596922 m.1596922 type:complete len:1046 (-) comp25343_c2_seq8:2371-5508(-)
MRTIDDIRWLFIAVQLLLTISQHASDASRCGRLSSGTCRSGGVETAADSVVTATECQRYCESLGVADVTEHESKCCQYNSATHVCTATTAGFSATSSEQNIIATSCALLGGQKQAHVMFVILDDAGWNDFDFQGANAMETPTLADIALDGVRLRRHYSMHVCGPTRAALLTGRNPIRFGLSFVNIYPDMANAVPTSEPLMAEAFRQQGYVTRGYGKWHIGHSQRVHAPTYRGFDSWHGGLTGSADHWTHTISIKNGSARCTGYDSLLFSGRSVNTVPSDNGVFSTDYITNAVVDDVYAHNVEKPLLLYINYYAPHTPAQAPAADVRHMWSKYPTNFYRRMVAAQMRTVDRGVSQLRTAMQNKGLWNDTVFVLLSDNGGTHFADNIREDRDKLRHSNFPLRGFKATGWEGGCRTVAFLYTVPDSERSYPVRWRGLADSLRGGFYDNVFHLTDWKNTLLDFGNQLTGRDVEGVGMLNARRHFVRHDVMFNDRVICNASVVGQLAPTPAISGSGHSYRTCLLACYEQPRCVYFNHNAATGTCAMFQQCTQTMSAGTSLTTTYSRSEAQHNDIFSVAFEAGQPRCDYDVATQRATVSTLDGGGHAYLECLTVCYTHSDCNYFVHSPSGYCHMFTSCEARVPSTTDVTHVRRAQLDFHALHDVWEHFRILEEDVGMTCDSTDTEQHASISTLDSGAHTLHDCVHACEEQDDCRFFTFSSTAVCRMFTTCDTKGNAPGEVIYVRKELHAFTEHLQNTKCSTGVEHRSPLYMPVGAAVVTQQECATLCESQQERCAYFHIASDGSSCQMFVACDTTTDAETFTVFQRKHRVQVDGISQYGALTQGSADVPRPEAMLILIEDNNQAKKCPGNAPCGVLTMSRWKYAHGASLKGLYSFADSTTPAASPYTQPVTCDDVPATVATCVGADEICLFDLDNDPCEYVNVAPEHPEIVAKMQNHLADYWSVKKKGQVDDIRNGVCDASVVPPTSSSIGATSIIGFWLPGPEPGGPCMDYATDCAPRGASGLCSGTHPLFKYMYMNCRQTCALCTSPIA